MLFLLIVEEETYAWFWGSLHFWSRTYDCEGHVNSRSYQCAVLPTLAMLAESQGLPVPCLSVFLSSSIEMPPGHSNELSELSAEGFQRAAWVLLGSWCRRPVWPWPWGAPSWLSAPKSRFRIFPVSKLALLSAEKTLRLVSYSALSVGIQCYRSTINTGVRCHFPLFFSYIVLRVSTLVELRKSTYELACGHL